MNEQYTQRCVQALCTVGLCNKANVSKKGMKHILWLLFTAGILDKPYYQSLLDCVEGIRETDLDGHYCTAFGPGNGCPREWQEIIDNFEQAVIELQEFNKNVSRHPVRLPVLTPEHLADEFDTYTITAYQKDNNPKIIELPDFHKAKDLHTRVKILFQNIKQKFPQLQHQQISILTPPHIIFKPYLNPAVSAPSYQITDPISNQISNPLLDSNRPLPSIEHLNITRNDSLSLNPSFDSLQQSSLQQPSLQQLSLQQLSPQQSSLQQSSLQQLSPQQSSLKSSLDDFASNVSGPTLIIKPVESNVPKKRKKPSQKNKSSKKSSKKSLKTKSNEESNDESNDETEEKVIKIKSNKMDIERLNSILSNPPKESIDESKEKESLGSKEKESLKSKGSKEKESLKSKGSKESLKSKGSKESLKSKGSKEKESLKSKGSKKSNKKESIKSNKKSPKPSYEMTSLESFKPSKSLKKQKSLKNQTKEPSTRKLSKKNKTR